LTRFSLLTGSAHKTLATDIAAHLNLPLANASIGQFSDGESRIEILENMRGQDVFIIQPTAMPPNHHLIELILLADAIRRAKAHRIIAVIPYLSYMRQDKCLDPVHTPVGARVIADLLATCQLDRIITIDLHSEQLQGFFSTPLDTLYSTTLFLKDIAEKKYLNPLIVAPDIGGIRRARVLAQQLNAPFAIIDKQRFTSHKMQSMNVIGDIQGHDCIIVDDIIDTANTVCSAATLLKKNNAKSVVAYVTHPVLSGTAIHTIQSSLLDKLVVTDTIPLAAAAQTCSTIQVLSVSAMLSKTIETMYQDNL
jgi:ribose-phosphate pyrophosphokinase